jgi:uncharacterized protein
MNNLTAQPTLWRKLSSKLWNRFGALFMVTMVFNGLASLPGWYISSLAFVGKPRIPGAIPPLAYGIGILVATVLTSVLMAWLYTKLSAWLEQRKVTEFESGNRLGKLSKGILIGAGLVTASVAIMVALGNAHITTGQQFGLSLLTVVPVVAAPILEEVVFRGVFFRIFEQMYGTTIALVSSSLFFGLAHFFTPNSGWFPSLCIAVEAGLLLGLAYAATRSLWLPIGLHFGWNFTEGNILGCSVSGVRSHGIFETTTSGHALITGGAFGPEASIISLLVCLIGSAYFYRQAVKKGLWQPMCSKHTAPPKAGQFL